MKRTTRNIILVLAICAFVLISGLASAESSGTDGENVTWTIDDNGVLTVGGSGSLSKSTVDLRVNDRAKIKKVLLGPEISYVDPDFFWACTSFNTFEVDSQNAYYCSQGGILYDKSRTMLIRVPYAYTGDLKLISGLTAIGPSAAQYCQLNTVWIQEGVTEIGSNAFHGGAIRTVWLPASLKHIHTSAFYTVNSVLSDVHYAGTANEWEDVTIDEGNKELLFCTIHCSDGDAPEKTITGNIGTDITFSLTPEGLLTVSGSGAWGWSAFANSQKVRTAVLESGVDEIGSTAFMKCTNLTSITIPNTVTSIKDRAFWNSGLQTVHIPNSVVSMGALVFLECNSLSEIIFDGTVDEWHTLVDGTNNEKLDECTIHCSDGNITPKPKTGTIGEGISYTLTLDGTLTVTGAGEWYSWTLNYEIKSKIISIILESGVTEIGEGAFAYCPNLTQISIPDTVTEIKYEAFYGCDSLASVTIPESVETIRDVVFDECEILEEIQFEGTKAQWQELVNGTNNAKFSECIIKCTDGDYVETKAGEAEEFSWTLTGTELTINGTLFDYEDLPYEVCNVAKSVVIGATVHSLNNLWGFYKVNSYTVEEGNEHFVSVDGVIFTSDLETLYAFPRGRTGSYSVPEGTTTLGINAFSSSNIDSITLPNSLERIEGEAITWCYYLTEITIPANVSYIDGPATNFRLCSMLTNIYVDDENETYYDQDGILYQREGNVLMTYPGGRPESTIEIGGEVIDTAAFGNQRYISSVILEEGVKSIEEYAFSSSSLTDLSLPASLQHIGKSAFSSTSLDNVHYGGTVEQWNSIQIESENELLQLLEIHCVDGAVSPQEVSGSIGENVTYTLRPDGLLTVSGEGVWQSSVFESNAVIRSVKLQAGVSEIGSWAFGKCHNLQVVEIPKTVTSIGYAAFESCHQLTEIYYEGTAEEWKDITIEYANFEIDNATIYYNWNGWKELTNVLTLPEMLTKIESEAFAGLNNVDAVRISEKVTEIADDVFAGTDIVILAPAGSYAEEWAGEHGIPCRNE